MKAIFYRAPGDTLIPADEAAHALLASLKPGEGVSVEAKRFRNVQFHRKFFALLRLAFDAWEPEEPRTWRGEALRKDFDAFRKDVLILAGFFDASYSVDGSVSLEARSISFSKCDELEFAAVYSSVLDVLWSRVLSDAGYSSPEHVDEVVMELLRYC